MSDMGWSAHIAQEEAANYGAALHDLGRHLKLAAKHLENSGSEAEELLGRFPELARRLRESEMYVRYAAMFVEKQYQKGCVS